VSTKDYVRDLQALERSLSEARARVRSELSIIREKQRERSGKARGVSDHAVVRYLERTGRVDTEAARAEINELVDGSEAFKKVDGVWHSPTGMVFIVEDCTVVTVLSREQSERYLGRPLMSGGVAERIDSEYGSTPARSKPSDPIQCPMCDVVSTNPGDQYRHMLADHADQLGPVEAP
jgi:hypothetical protein